ncbi:peptidase M23 [Spirochaetia bacterium]|nr:peptidase M23 [Spirochaetia bacterium]
MCPPFSLFAQAPRTGEAEGAYPLISRLDVRDTAFKQYLDDVEAARRRIYNRQGGREADPQSVAEALTVYSYEPRSDEDLLALAARCNIPYAGIASLNRLSHPEDLGRQGVILLPSAPGIFIPENSKSDLENLISASRSSDDGIRVVIRRQGKGEKFLFIPGADFSPAERVFFLNQGFRFPLRAWRITSSFGPRVNPITGVYGIHRGLDLAAPEGTEVFAARDGTVADLGEDPVYGRYIIISHENNWVSLYGHLSKIETALKSGVKSGSLIGRVGSTGQSTGPHLHFEIRQNGQAQDPGRHLRIFKN